MSSNLAVPDEIVKAQWLAKFLDTAIKVPILNIRLGVDFLLGLIPGIGDFLCLLLSLKIIHYGFKLGVPKGMKVVMIRNVALDFLLGLIPIAGDLFDLFFKANRANVKLLESWWLQQNQQLLDENTKQNLTTWKKSLD